MNVAMIELVGGYGGLDIYDLGVCSALVNAGCNVRFYTCGETKDLTLDEKLVIEKKFGKMFDKRCSKFRRFFYFLRGLMYTYNDIRKTKVDVVYMHVFTFNIIELCVLIASIMTNKKVFVNVHDPISFGKKSLPILKRIFIYLFGIGRVNVTTHTNYSMGVLASVMPSVPIRLMPHSDIDFINGTTLGKTECKIELGLNTNYKYILFFGQIKSTKGLETLLRAWQMVCVQDESVKLLIAGRCWQNNCSQYLKLIDDLGIKNSVIWRESYIKNEDAPLYFKAAEFVVLPYTRIYSSGVLLRAVGYGSPVIVSNQMAFLEFITDEKSGLVFETSNHKHLAARLKTALTNPELLVACATCAKSELNEKYSWGVIGKQMCEIFMG